MKGTRKITVHVPAEILQRAQEATGQGVTATVRKGLEIVAASRAYEKLLQMRGKVKLSLDLNGLREDRR